MTSLFRHLGRVCAQDAPQARYPHRDLASTVVVSVPGHESDDEIVTRRYVRTRGYPAYTPTQPSALHRPIAESGHRRALSHAPSPQTRKAMQPLDISSVTGEPYTSPGFEPYEPYDATSSTNDASRGAAKPWRDQKVCTCRREKAGRQKLANGRSSSSKRDSGRARRQSLNLRPAHDCHGSNMTPAESNKFECVNDTSWAREQGTKNLVINHRRRVTHSAFNRRKPRKVPPPPEFVPGALPTREPIGVLHAWESNSPIILGPLYFPVGSTGLAYLLGQQPDIDVKLAFLPLCPDCLLCLVCHPPVAGRTKSRCERCRIEVGDTAMSRAELSPYLNQLRWNEEISRAGVVQGKGTEKVTARFGLALLFPQPRDTLERLLDIMLAEALEARREALMTEAGRRREECASQNRLSDWHAHKTAIEGAWEDEKHALVACFERRKGRLLSSKSGPRDDFTEAENLRALAHYLQLQPRDCPCRELLPRLKDRLIDDERMAANRAQRRVRKERLIQEESL